MSQFMPLADGAALDIDVEPGVGMRAVIALSQQCAIDVGEVNGIFGVTVSLGHGVTIQLPTTLARDLESQLGSILYDHDHTNPV